MIGFPSQGNPHNILAITYQIPGTYSIIQGQKPKSDTPVPFEVKTVSYRHQVRSTRHERCFRPWVITNTTFFSCLPGMRFDFWASDFDPIVFSSMKLANRNSCAWEWIRFRRKKMSSLFENPLKKIERTIFENGLPPQYLLGFRLHSRVAPSTWLLDTGNELNDEVRQTSPFNGECSTDYPW